MNTVNERRFLKMNKGIIGGAIAGAVTLVVSAVGARSYHKKHTYGEDGFNGYGYDKDGYDREGYNKKGYNKAGFNRDGYNISGFNSKGFDKDGYDENGYNSKGYNRDGRDKDGYDVGGYDKSGFNKDGIDKDGFNRSGWDSEGYNRKGRDKDGYDREGKDYSGYFRSGFNSDGYDRGGKTVDYYTEKCGEIKVLISKAYARIDEKEFKYALSDIREGLEKGVKCVIMHLKGESYLKPKQNLDELISICKWNDLLELEFVEKLYDAKNHCNDLQHDNDIQKELRQVWFAYRTLEELYDRIEEYKHSENEVKS